MRIISCVITVFLLIGCGQTGGEEKIHLTIDVKERDEQVEFIITLINGTEQSTQFEFRSAQKYEIIIRNLDGKDIYKYSRERMFIQMVEYLEVDANKKKTWREQWDYKDNNGNRVEKGTYEIEVMFLGKSEHIEHLWKKEKINIR
ncbi:BsuPI-related putative proteinase inhibitor [Metabacillus fastidiosus]|uniref:BsuPI-related putative proteinase inhibitor n=1 Tax=Metabacillus fastidiosus TaxID=1458 RepID=UPI003D2A9138